MVVVAAEAVEKAAELEVEAEAVEEVAAVAAEAAPSTGRCGRCRRPPFRRRRSHPR